MPLLPSSRRTRRELPVSDGSASSVVSAVAASFWFWLLSSPSSSGSALERQLSPVQSTAILTAYWRHLETTSSRRKLVDDPTAAALVDGLLTSTSLRAEFDRSPIRDSGIDCLAVRTKFIDDWLLPPMGRKGSSSATTRTTRRKIIINLGAGMCGRPYRLDFNNNDAAGGGVDYYEVDSDLDLLRIKHRVLKEDAGLRTSCCSLTLVGTNLENVVESRRVLEERIVRTGDVTPTDWIAEGLLEYLDPITVHSDLLQMAYDLSDSKSRMIVQLLEPPVAELFLEKLGASLPWKPLVEASVFCEQAVKIGWKKVQVVDHRELGEMYNFTFNVPGYKLICLEKD